MPADFKLPDKELVHDSKWQSNLHKTSQNMQGIFILFSVICLTKWIISPLCHILINPPMTIQENRKRTLIQSMITYMS